MGRQRDSLTGDLFKVPCAPEPTEGSLDYATELRHVLNAALKKTPLSRYQVAARMSELTGEEITKTMLDAWTAESKTAWRFPFEYAAAFEAACSTPDHQETGLQDLLSRKRGGAVMHGDDVLLAKLGRIRQQQTDLAAQEKALKRHLGKKQ